MRAAELLNDWGAAWAAFMSRSLVEATALLIAMLLLWVPLRRRISSQFAYGLFLLVLLKATAPVSLTLPAGVARLTPRHAVVRLAAWPTAVVPGGEPASRTRAARA